MLFRDNGRDEYWQYRSLTKLIPVTPGRWYLVTVDTPTDASAVVTAVQGFPVVTTRVFRSV